MDIIGFITTQEPVASWTSAKKQAMLDDLCATLNYQKTIYDEEGNGTQNTQTKKEFANEKILNQLKVWVNDWRRSQAEKELTIEEVTFNE